jgi:hypothetical protein
LASLAGAAMRTPAEQVDAMLAEIAGGSKTIYGIKALSEHLRPFLLKLAHGDYLEEPIPITRPGKAYAEMPQFHSSCGGVRIFWAANDIRFDDLRGPVMPTKREAILAWNTGLAR